MFFLDNAIVVFDSDDDSDQQQQLTTADLKQQLVDIATQLLTTCQQVEQLINSLQLLVVVSVLTSLWFIVVRPTSKHVCFVTIILVATKADTVE